MDVLQLQRKLRYDGFLDDQFSQLQKLQDESSPDFVIEVVKMFFDDSEKLLNNMTRALGQVPVDFISLEICNLEIGKTCDDLPLFVVVLGLPELRMSVPHSVIIIIIERCVRCLQQLQNEYSLLKNNLQYLFRLQEQIQAAGGSIPTIE
ncbi:histidine-containing phosphotransfer protein 3 [Arachis ipaensis]|uniref:histidine-containing phosphotransfer protein 3 n=1 Tax=Arachis ipaensis TaxID=130454 RepID=UPI000A2B19B5|nr:histidine-containing phosphotransfer protein 3 [Arachis ipaensis]